MHVSRGVLRAVMAVVIGLGLVLAGVVCDDDPPTKPVEPKEYPFYFADITGNIYIFHPTTQRLDSMAVPWDMRFGVTVSADGERLYLAGQNEVTVITADSYELITSFPFPSLRAPAVSPDGSYFAALGWGCQVRRTTDFSIVYEDTLLAFSEGRFTDDSRAFYHTVSGLGAGSTNVLRVDLTVDPCTVSTKNFPNVYTYGVIPNQDESRWFLYTLLRSTYTYAFEVYDVAGDSIIFQDQFMPGHGRLAVSPDYRYAFYTTPGDFESGSPDFHLRVFDVEANEVARTIINTEFFTDSMWIAYPHCIAVTADSRWLGILGGDWWADGLFYLYDIENDSLTYRGPWDFWERFLAQAISTQAVR